MPESRVLLVDFAARLDAEIRKAGARTALYMVWPSRARRGDVDRVSESYAMAAAKVGGLLLPVGDAWQSAWAIEAGLPLYASDGLHPSAMGTYLASIVIYGGIFGEPAPATGVTPAQTDVLRRAAAATLARLNR